MAHDVFISHSSQDKTVSDAICAALEAAGLRCWIAPRDVQPGRSFAGEITRAIEQSKAMVLVFSANSNNSSQVLREVQLAVSAQLHILQFRIEEVLLNDDLKYYLSTPHWLDAMTPPLENHLGRLAGSLKTLLGEAAVTTDPIIPDTGKPTGSAPRASSETKATASVPASRPVNSTPRSSRIRALVAAGVVGVIVLGVVLLRPRQDAPSATFVHPRWTPTDVHAVIRINFDELRPGFLEPDAFALQSIRLLKTTGGRPAINEADPGMIMKPGHRQVLNVRGNDPETKLIFEFDQPIKRFTLTRIGANPGSLPTWTLEARDASGRLVDSLSQMRGTPDEPRIRDAAYFTVSASSISSVVLAVDNRNGTGTWATYNCLPLVEIEFQR